jgi:hypothetical protein
LEGKAASEGMGAPQRDRGGGFCRATSVHALHPCYSLHPSLFQGLDEY